MESAHLLEIMRALWGLGRAAGAGREEENWRTSASRGAYTRHRRRGQDCTAGSRTGSLGWLVQDTISGSLQCRLFPRSSLQGKMKLLVT